MYLYGGLALALYAKPKATLDIDLRVDSGSIDSHPGNPKNVPSLLLAEYSRDCWAYKRSNNQQKVLLWQQSSIHEPLTEARHDNYHQ